MSGPVHERAGGSGDLMLLNAWCPMHDKVDPVTGEPIEHSSTVRLRFVPLPNDPANDAWVCSLPEGECSWFITVNKGQTGAGDFWVQP